MQVEIKYSKKQADLEYAAKLLVIAAKRLAIKEGKLPLSENISNDANGCLCGYYGDSQRSCSCTPNQIQRYLSRISGPLLDRIDLHLEVPRVAYQELNTKEPGEPSAVIKERVQAARRRQQERLGSKNTCNARLKPNEVRKYCHLTKEAKALLAAAFRQLHLSARAHDRILKVALTIADLAQSKVIEAAHLAEAIQYRNLESKYYLS